VQSRRKKAMLYFLFTFARGDIARSKDPSLPSSETDPSNHVNPADCQAIFGLNWFCLSNAAD
jgi:hypothetical protein